MVRNIIIIGSGPAGYTAAIYAARAGLKPLILTGLKVGGQLMDTGDVENFPGYKNGISGPLMMEDLREQSLKFGTEIVYKDVIKVDFTSKPYKIYDDNNNEYLTKSVVISTGATAKWLGEDFEKKYNGYGVSACATCDGFFYRDMNVVVVGGGDTACEEALYLSNICKNVTMLVRSNNMRASNIMQDRVKRNEKITILYNTSIKEVVGEETSIDHIITNNNSKIECTGIFIAIGHKPNTDIFKEYIKTDNDGYIVTEAGSTKTNVDGVFACGDVQDRIYRQAITAAGTGCMAALDAERYLSNLN